MAVASGGEGDGAVLRKGRGSASTDMQRERGVLASVAAHQE